MAAGLWSSGRSVVSSSFASEREAFESLLTDLNSLTETRKAFLRRPVDVPEEALASAKTREAVERGASQGKPFGMLAFGSGDAKQQLTKVRVAGLPPDGADDWMHVLRFLALHQQLLSFAARWNRAAVALSAPAMRVSIEAFREIEVIATTGAKAHRLGADYDVTLRGHAEAVFEKPPIPELLGSSQDLKRVRDQLLAHVTRAELSTAKAQLANLKGKLEDKTGPISDRLRTFVNETLGSPGVSSEQAVASYADLVSELRRLAALTAELSTVRDFSKRTADVGAPRLADRLRNEQVPVSGEDTTFQQIGIRRGRGHVCGRTWTASRLDTN